MVEKRRQMREDVVGLIAVSWCTRWSGRQAAHADKFADLIAECKKMQYPHTRWHLQDKRNGKQAEEHTEHVAVDSAAAAWGNLSNKGFVHHAAWLANLTEPNAL